MRLRNAPRKRRSGKSIALTFLLLLTLPVFVFGLLQNSSFDFRNKAFEDLEISETNPCLITFPNVNPYSIQVNSTVRLQVDALSQAFTVKSIQVNDSMGNILLTKVYTDSPKMVTESFSFTPLIAKAYNITGKMIDSNDTAYECVISSTYDVMGVRAITSNTKPVFTSSPKDSIPSQNIQVGVTYEYTIEAEDADKDTINYAYSFTPQETWLKSTVIEDGSNGKLTIKLKGSTNEPGSYLANIFIHDGYSTHLSSQSWVISVSPKGNSIPIVKIIEPVNSVVVKDLTPLKLTWETTDDNKILRHEIYISSNPANQSSWKVIDKNVAGNQTSYTVNIPTLPDGAYRIIVRAIDDQTPAGIGMDISEEILISRTPPVEPETPDDQVILPEPQIINMSPTSTDIISNTTPTIKASLISTEGSTINSDTLVVKIDNKDISKEVKINKISDSEYTLIYIPEQPLTIGLHKVDISFEDSRGASTEKNWTFTIAGEEEEGESFSLFGFSIAKRTAYIIAGGLALIVLAIVIPMIIVAIWKDGSKETVPNSYTLPPTPTVPKELPPFQPSDSEVRTLVTETFDAPEPVAEITEQKEGTLPPEPIIETPSDQQPTDDLTSLYKQIEEVKEQNSQQNDSNSTS